MSRRQDPTKNPTYRMCFSRATNMFPHLRIHHLQRSSGLFAVGVSMRAEGTKANEKADENGVEVIRHGRDGNPGYLSA